ncbi:phosphoribosyl-dephospho-CoA transferase [Geopseudomonas sagittaria]|uniref:Phosphoribosyl-dephospho-CoA transferase n=1 Tax=Geopseudomonas sagittaria TaxID=1135990 RepID=A0A1I5PV75_9GAMM|nr:malonate decarboxylase holo-ACP synthase [Pseudomonas sagittaria]SFP37864.1 phosphoribosyl-dephospho-CoA transferase [Pseudomonas sagittaria]
MPAIDFQPQAHDLLWGLSAEQLDAGAPDWARDVLAAGQPVVVRRGSAPQGQVAVGVRGRGREQRHATWMPLAAISRRVAPEQLTGGGAGQDAWPALRALAWLAPQLDALGLAWGVTGGAGYQLASGAPVLHGNSDLDLLLRAPQPLAREAAAELLALLDRALCRVDLQLETPAGAIALREWAGPAPQVLLKTEQGPRLVRDPWQEVTA